jgi:hypothetical protein
MKHTEEMIKDVACYISNPIYNDNLQATKELMELFDELKEQKISKYIAENPLETYKDYVRMYDESFYTYTTFEELVESEEEQNFGLTEEECKKLINEYIWQLPCGWYIHYV